MKMRAAGLDRIRDICLVAGLLLAPVGIYVPLDHWTAGLFHLGGGEFWLNDSWVGTAFHGYIRPAFYWLLAAIVVALAVRSFRMPGHRWLTLRRLLYVGAVVGIGLGLVTNNILKDRFDRPRPMQTVEYGGEARYQPPVLPAKGCERNCSFVSGDAAAGFVLIALPLAFASGRRRWQMMKLTLWIGATVGLLRMMNGSHYLFDVVYAGLINVAIAAVLWRPFMRWHWAEVRALPGRVGIAGRAAGEGVAFAWRWLRHPR